MAQASTYVLNIEAFMQARARFYPTVGQPGNVARQGSKPKAKSKGADKVSSESGSSKLSKRNRRESNPEFRQSGSSKSDRNSSESGSSNSSESNF